MLDFFGREIVKSEKPGTYERKKSYLNALLCKKFLVYDNNFERYKEETQS